MAEKKIEEVQEVEEVKTEETEEKEPLLVRGAYALHRHKGKIAAGMLAIGAFVGGALLGGTAKNDGVSSDSSDDLPADWADGPAHDIPVVE